MRGVPRGKRVESVTEQKFKWLIIGAGPTGLAAAHRLRQAGEKDILVLEKESRPGGLSASFLDEQGFTWDLGGHVFFSHYAAYDRLLDETIPARAWHRHRQAAWIRRSNSLIPYPFQLHVGWLPEREREACLRGLRDLPSPPPPAENFHEWILTRFGRGIAELFMEPYNRNLWACPTEKMGVYWLGDRVALPSPRMLAAGTREQWGPNREFRFPPQGGTGSIWSALADSLGRATVRCGQEVQRIDLADRRVVLGDGNSVQGEHILSTMPLDELARRTGMGSDLFPYLSSDLRRSPIAVVGLGIEGPRPQRLEEFTWMYFPESLTRIYRVTDFGRYSPANVPDPGKNWSLLIEAASLGEKVSLPEVTAAVEVDLAGYGLLPVGARIVSRWARLVPYGYPVPTLTRERTRLPLLSRLEGQGIFSRGRFGAWCYEVGNMDHSAMQGVEWAERMLGGGLRSR